MHEKTLLKPCTESARCDFIAEWNHRHGLVITEDNVGIYADTPVPSVSVGLYDDIMESHLLAERSARGYTTREPSAYTESTNVRWASDAADWTAHLTAVMEYALSVENAVAAGQPAPTPAEFKAALPVITWSIAEV